MKLIKEILYETFRKESDPVHDMKIDYNWKIIKKGTQLPDDFVEEGVRINRTVYIVEVGFIEDDFWENEYSSSNITLEIIGATIIGSTQYHAVRFRNRTKYDEPWDVKKTIEYGLYSDLFGKV